MCMTSISEGKTCRFAALAAILNERLIQQHVIFLKSASFLNVCMARCSQHNFLVDMLQVSPHFEILNMSPKMRSLGLLGALIHFLVVNLLATFAPFSKIPLGFR